MRGVLKNLAMAKILLNVTIYNLKPLNPKPAEEVVFPGGSVAGSK